MLIKQSVGESVVIYCKIPRIICYDFDELNLKFQIFVNLNNRSHRPMRDGQL